MQAAEQPDDCVKSLVDFIVAELLELLLELVVGVEGHMVGRLVVLVHEVLERLVSRFLKSHVVVESLLYELVHLLFECQQL